MKEVVTPRQFEIDVIRLLCSSLFSASALDALDKYQMAAEYQYTGCGYFLDIQLPDLPMDRHVLTEPWITGDADGVLCGFIVFIESGTLSLECHSWGEIDIPPNFRDRNVILALPDMVSIDSDSRSS